MTADATTDPIAETRRWLQRAVIGLNLCPFAKAVAVKSQVRWVLSDAASEPDLLAALGVELALLRDTPPAIVDTTLLIHPQVFADFYDYNDFLGTADALVAEMDLEGVLQIASFHPQYRFAGSGEDDIENFSNRSPHPMLHLLREDSVTRAVAAYPDADAIIGRNMRTLRRLGHDGWRKLFAD
ncbi:DUF1415 domain-containing protein [Luteimonas sp. R10]|uniref:DUF1415 domain-containing protein n=1 Tax=Luteimonas sp. R10 TaxID=3108176 RepID=UPI0030870DAF|nr:DUF1415 domain-containing protein [Luteimonas sp. R10]